LSGVAFGVTFWLPPHRATTTEASRRVPPAFNTGAWLKYTGNCVPSYP
jgi:hypothetical protein